MSKSPTHKEPAAAETNFPVVGFGASAGGLEAFSQVLSSLPSDTGMAFVLVQHRDPQHDGLVRQLLGRATKMPVERAMPNMPAMPDHVYVVPPSMDMIVQEGHLRRRSRPASNGWHLPVDHFLASLAEDCGTNAIGVVLSGLGSDGTRGLHAVKAANGITMAQSTDSARHGAMPGSAIAAGVVDHVMSPVEIAQELVRLGRHCGTGAALVNGESEIADVLRTLRVGTGVDFSAYEASVIRRRVARRMLVRRIDRVAQYLDFLRATPAELPALYNEILLHVTGFFRDPATFRLLTKSVFPKMLKQREPYDAIRIWVPACSTGEEVYSIAIALAEAMRETGTGVPVKIFATDISEPAIRQARTGVYSEQVALNVPPDLLPRYFTRTENGYEIIRPLREMCTFGRHDIESHAPYSQIDLISCRNLLTSIRPEARQKAMESFRSSLNPGGYLLPGGLETIEVSAEGFTLVDAKHRIYTIRGGEHRSNRGVEDESLGSINTAHLAPILERVPVGIMQSDAAGEILFANAEACRIAGVTLEDALSGVSNLNVHPDDVTLLNSVHEGILAAGEGYTVEFRFLRPNGKTVWAQKTTTRLRDASGVTTGFLSAITDVTDRKQLEEKLLQSQKMEAIGRVTGGVAHDFNNMLTAISGYAHQVRAALPKSHEAYKAAEQLSRTTEQASMLTRQLLAFSRKQIMRPRALNLNDLLYEMHDLLVRLLGENIEVTLAPSPESATVMADPVQIQQVVLNLAINARDAMAAGGKLTLGTSVVSRDGGAFVMLAVSDTGVGMDAATRDRLFEPFFTTKPTGTGLGLSLVQGIAQQCGGWVAAESEVGVGTTLRVYLPRAAGHTESARSRMPRSLPGGSETVLLVEDASVVRSLVRELLEQRGYKVLEARNGDEALAVSDEHPGTIHVLLTDMLMPRISGNELAKRMRARRRGIKVVFMSGYSGEALQALEKDANFLQKPFRADELATVIRKALR